MKGILSFNGEITPLEQAKIPVLDRGFLYGDGVFEGINFIDKKILFHIEHLDRLYRSAAHIRLPMPSKEHYEVQLFKAVQSSDWQNGYLRVVATRGVGAMGISPAKHLETNLYIIVTTIQLYSEEKYQQGIKIIVANTRKIPLSSFDCSVKSLCYLPNIMAMWEAIDQGADEAIMTDSGGIVSEATVENIFGISKKTIFTPSLETNCLAGITRKKIMEIARKHELTVEEGRYTVEDFVSADEVFLTGTGAGIVPVRQIDDKIIGIGKMGSITASIRSEYNQNLKNYCT